MTVSYTEIETIAENIDLKPEDALEVAQEIDDQPNVAWQVWIRAIALLVSTLNTLAVMLFGFDPFPFTQEQIYAGVSGLVEVALITWAWWKNNSFTKPALIGDVVKDVLKDDGHEG